MVSRRFQAPPSSLGLIHGVDISAKFKKWETTAEKGDIVVVLNKDKIGLIDKSEYNLTLSNYFQEP